MGPGLKFIGNTYGEGIASRSLSHDFRLKEFAPADVHAPRRSAAAAGRFSGRLPVGLGSNHEGA